MTPTNTIIDSHCHLADTRIYPELDLVLERAAAAGVGRIVAVGALETIDADRLTVEVAERYPQVFAVIGVHPHNASDCDDDRMAKLERLARSPRVVAIGESGLDFHYMHSPPEAQEHALRRHLELARALGRPIVIHCRKAERRLCEIVGEAGLPPAGGVIHCFTGDAAAARDFVALGFHVSFSGILTFKNAQPVREAASIVSEDRLMVETDAPYLAPEPYRGARNEPAYVRRTFERLAELRGADPVAFASLLRANTTRLFGLPED